MSATLLSRMERKAVILQPSYDRHLALIEEHADEWGGMLANPTIEDMAGDLRMPTRAREYLRRSRALAQKGIVLEAGYGPFWQMMDGAVMLADQTAITGTAETAMFPVAQYGGTAANQFRGGQLWYLRTTGICTTPGASQGNLTITPRYGTSTGGVSLGASAATAFAASATNAPWLFEYLFVIRSAAALAGANYPAYGNGCFQGAIALIAAATGPIVLGSTASVNIDLTIAGGMFIGVTMGSASDSMKAMASPLSSLN